MVDYTRLTYLQFASDPGLYCEQEKNRFPKFAEQLSLLGYPGVNALDFYGDLFGDELQEEQQDKESYQQGEYSAITLELVPGKDKQGNDRLMGRRRLVTREMTDLWDLINTSDNQCYMAAASYAGRNRRNDNARYLYAIVIDLDGIVEAKFTQDNRFSRGLMELIHQWNRDVHRMPKPTYMVCSGGGLHLYYVFKRPIPLFSNVFKQLSEVKRWMTKGIWSSYVTNYHDKIQFQGLCQAFRIVGTKTKYGGRALAFKVGDKITLEELNSYLPKKYQVSIVYKSDLPLAKAKELYPEWYQRRIVEGGGKKHYNRYEGIYHNWVDKIMDPDKGAKVGHRYHCLENLCSLAVQCEISPEQLQADITRVSDYFESLTNDEKNHFTIDDQLAAMDTYDRAGDDAYYRKIEYISEKTGIDLIPNKRNGRTQEQHIKRITALRDIDYPDGSWREGNGRKPKDKIVYEWRQAHPDGKKADCIKDTGLTKPTVYKWWDYYTAYL